MPRPRHAPAIRRICGRQPAKVHGEVEPEVEPDRDCEVHPKRESEDSQCRVGRQAGSDLSARGEEPADARAARPGVVVVIEAIALPSEERIRRSFSGQARPAPEQAGAHAPLAVALQDQAGPIGTLSVRNAHRARWPSAPTPQPRTGPGSPSHGHPIRRATGHRGRTRRSNRGTPSQKNPKDCRGTVIRPNQGGAGESSKDPGSRGFMRTMADGPELAGRLGWCP